MGIAKIHSGGPYKKNVPRILDSVLLVCARQARKNIRFDSNAFLAGCVANDKPAMRTCASKTTELSCMHFLRITTINSAYDLAT
jgi:hypothetical protein